MVEGSLPRSGQLGEAAFAADRVFTTDITRAGGRMVDFGDIWRVQDRRGRHGCV
jgi:hypothetical protein